MSLKTPTALEGVLPVTGKALALASQLAQNDMTRFRFKLGGVFVLAALVIFFLGHIVTLTQYFTGDFAGHAWIITWALIILGAAFSGKEVVEALASSMKSLPGKH